MRTTVTLDSDTERLIKRAMAERGQSFKHVLNEAVQRGLATIDGDDEPPFQVEPHAMGLRPGIDAARLNSLVDELDLDAFADVAGRQQA